MDTNPTNRITALQLWLATAPDRRLFHRGLALAGRDADAIFREVDRIRMDILRQISELESLNAISPAAPSAGKVLPFPVRS